MRIMKLAKYRLKAQVEKDEGPSGEGQSPRVEKDEGQFHDSHQFVYENNCL